MREEVNPLKGRGHLKLTEAMHGDRGTEGGDVELLRQLRQGNEKALEEILRLYQAKIYGLGLRMLRDHQDAEEACQILDLSLPALKSRLHRARLFLRKELADYLVTGQPALRPDNPGKSDAKVS